MFNLKYIYRYSFMASILLLQACTTAHYNNTFEQPLSAQLTRITSSHIDLINLPIPSGKIPVSVYSFRDQTGQYKQPTGVSSFSTAVTQGATSILIQALKDSKWFAPMEREGLQNLLTERKIIRATLKNNKNNPQPDIPPLKFSNILLEGGITGYDSNIQTGGIGVKYFGIGADTKYRVDQVTVHMRAIDILTGEILSTISTTKSILSREVHTGIFRFVSFKRLFETESGLTTNEPAVLCVTGAIEKAVTGLVIEGILNNHWSTNNISFNNHPSVKSYLQQKKVRQLTIVELTKLNDATDEEFN
jgi:curli production assembly/transport component CsgG